MTWIKLSRLERRAILWVILKFQLLLSYSTVDRWKLDLKLATQNLVSWTLRSTGNHTHEIYAIKVCYKSCYKSCNFYPVLVTLSIFHLLVHAETPLRPVSGRYFWTQNRYRCAISLSFLPPLLPILMLAQAANLGSQQEQS